MNAWLHLSNTQVNFYVNYHSSDLRKKTYGCSKFHFHSFRLIMSFNSFKLTQSLVPVVTSRLGWYILLFGWFKILVSGSYLLMGSYKKVICCVRSCEHLQVIGSKCSEMQGMRMSKFWSLPRPIRWSHKKVMLCYKMILTNQQLN